MSFVQVPKIVRYPLPVAVLILVLSGDAITQERPDFTEMLKVARVSASLTQDERALAVRLAEETLRSNKLLPDRKTFLTSVQTHRDGESEKKGIFGRNALLVYYRYAGDVGIRVFVDLAQQRVTKLDQLPHFPAPLAPEEVQLARELALNDPRLKNELAPLRDRLTVEPLLTRIPARRDPLFRHRLVHLLLRVGPRYVAQQGLVLVDLTTETVIIKPNPEKQSGVRKH
jgi:hypothetical protein